MSIVLKDGTVLPDIPSDVLAADPYAAIFHVKFSANGNEQYTLLVASSEIVYVPEEFYGMGIGVVNFTSGHGHLHFYTGGTEWVADGAASTGGYMVGTMPNMYTSTMVWANHDIMIATAVDVENELVTEVGTEIYFPNSEAPKPPFVLPDGTELPALPEGCFETLPYGAVLKLVEDGVGTYLFGISPSGGIYVPAAIAGGDYNLIHSTTEGEGYIYVLGTHSDWQYNGTGKFNDPLIEGTLELKWSNHDILTATAQNDDGTYEVGPDLYRKSDVNYRIYGGWLNSMGNQARRLGNVSGALKPGEMETVFSGATLEPLTVTPTSEAQTFTPESPCIGFSSVTVEAAEVEKEIVEVEVIKEYPDAETTVFGNEYVTEAVPTGRYYYHPYLKSVGTTSSSTYGEIDASLDPVPEYAAYPYIILLYNNYYGRYEAYLTDKPAYCDASNNYIRMASGSKCIELTHGVNYLWYVNPDQVWKEYNTNLADFTISSPIEPPEQSGGSFVAWSNYNIMIGSDGSGGVYLAATAPIPQTIGSTVAKPIEHPGDGMYQISGDTLNALIGLVQQMSGGQAMTPGDAADYLNGYLGNDTTT